MLRFSDRHNIRVDMPDYPIPPRNSQPVKSLLVQALRSVTAPVLRQITYLLGLTFVTVFIPFVLVALVLFGIFMISLKAVAAIYIRLTGRRVDWVEHALPLSRTPKISPVELN